MIKKGKMLSVLAVGVSAGIVLGWALFGRPVDVVDRITELLDDHCTPFIKDLGLVINELQHTPTGDLRTYGDGDTKLLITFSEEENRRDCTISDILAVVNPEDLPAIYGRVGAWDEKHVKPLNEGDFVAQELERDGVGMYHVLYRPYAKTGHLLSVITFPEQYQGRTRISFGWGDFGGSIPVAGGADV